MVAHQDHSEHSVKVIISEYGVADLRGKCPEERAQEIINNCVHPDYRPLLQEYIKNAPKGQTRFDMYNAFAFHEAFQETGNMKNVTWRKPKNA